eukprot:2032600-Rhodomonas_salina.1
MPLRELRQADTLCFSGGVEDEEREEGRRKAACAQGSDPRTCWEGERGGCRGEGSKNLTAEASSQHSPSLPPKGHASP